MRAMGPPTVAGLGERGEEAPKVRGKMSKSKILLGLLFAALAAFAPSARAQCSLSQVSGTITDSNNIPYRFGDISVDLVSPGGGNPVCANGFGFNSHQGPTALDGNGHFTLAIPINTGITPAGTTWNFTVHSGATETWEPCSLGPVGFTDALPITNNPQDVSLALSAASKPQNLCGGGGLGGCPLVGPCPINVDVNGSLIGKEPTLDVIPGTNVTVAPATDSGGAVHLTFNATTSGSGCALPGVNTGVLSEHPAGTCYDSLHFTWDDGTAAHNMQAGDGSNSLGTTANLIFDFGSGNGLCGANGSNPATCSHVFNAGTGSAVENAFNTGNTFTQITNLGDFSILNGNMSNFYLLGGGPSSGTGNAAFTDATSSISESMCLLQGCQSNTGGMEALNGGSLSFNVLAGVQNTLTANGSAAVAQDVNFFGFLNTLVVSDTSLASSIFKYGENLSMASSGASSIQDYYSIGTSNTGFGSSNQTAVGASQSRFLIDVGFVNSFASSAGHTFLRTYSIGDQISQSASTANTLDMFGFGHGLTQSNCSTCFLFGSGLTNTTSSFMGFGFTGAGELQITPGAVSVSYLTPGNCVQAGTGGLLATTSAACGSGSGGTPGGATDAVQFNNAGAFGGVTPPTTNGVYQIVHNVTGGVAVPPTAALVGLLPRSINGAATTDTTLFSDNGGTIAHDRAATGAVTETLPTAITLGNPDFVVSYCNYSPQTDTITPTTWTINGNASISVAPKTCHRISINPFSSTDWLSIGQGPGIVPTGPIPIANGGTGTGSTLTGLVRGSASAMTAAELSGDATTSGSNAVTLATVNSNVGSFTNANITVNAKGLITAAANGTGSGVTAVTGTSPIASSGGTTPAISCPTCVTSAASLTNTAIMTGAGSQGSQTPSATATLSSAGNMVLPGTLAIGSSPPTCTAGTGGSNCLSEGTAATGASSVDDIDALSSQHALAVNNNNTGDMPINRTVCVNVTPVTVAANVTTDQNLMACSLNANTLNVVGHTLRVYVAGVYSTAAASIAALSFKVKLCTVSGCGSGTVITPLPTTTGATSALSASNLAFNLGGLITTQTAGASSAYEAHGTLTIDLSSTATVPDSAYNDTNTATVGTIDSTGALFLQITAAASAASTSNSFTERQLIVELVN